MASTEALDQWFFGEEGIGRKHRARSLDEEVEAAIRRLWPSQDYADAPAFRNRDGRNAEQFPTIESKLSTPSRPAATPIATGAHVAQPKVDDLYEVNDQTFIELVPIIAILAVIFGFCLSVFGYQSETISWFVVGILCIFVFALVGVVGAVAKTKLHD